MKRKTKTYINRGIIGCLIVMGVISAGAGINEWDKWEKEVPDDFLVIQMEDESLNLKKEEFPQSVSFVYSMKDGLGIIGEDKLIVYGEAKEGHGDEYHLVEKNGEGYTFLTGPRAGYSYTGNQLYDVTEPFSFDKKTGTLTVTFNHYDQFDNFVYDMDYGENYRDIVEYIKKKETKSE